jgi:K+-sensing histidine kinase KdpD
VTLFLVEHRLRDVGEGHLAALRDALQEIALRLDGAADGQRIRYVRSTVVTGQDRCICLFEASSEALVRRANELAQVPVASIAIAVDYDFGEER